MPGDRLQPPPSQDDAALLVDWLELMALCDPQRRARIDELMAMMNILHDPWLYEAEAESRSIKKRIGDESLLDDEEDETYYADAMMEDVRARMENEIEFRKKALDTAYPYELDPLGEELKLVGNITHEDVAFYLCCLLSSYLNDKNDLIDLAGIHDIDQIRNALRNDVFQILATYAMAGLAQGSAVRVGWPRENKETLLKALKRAVDWGIGLEVRSEPGPYTPSRTKDGGIDVLAWRNNDRPPPAATWFGQVASGKNWKDKPAITEVDNFVGNFFKEHVRSNKLTCTIIPYRISEEGIFYHEHCRHGAILDRTRLAREALAGLEMANKGQIKIDHLDDIYKVTEWVVGFAEAICD